ncbi:MAG: winged helix-turn-helix transcriptional regulator [Actinobacteria bacterium]|nr:winged helix-turn-helix transcriptional regulator [Actinomycetota bacterium]
MSEPATQPQSEEQEQLCVAGPLEVSGQQDSIGFMLSRIGAAVSDRFAALVAEHDLDPRRFLVLNLISEHEGESQQAIARSIGVAKSRMVAVVDELESDKLLVRHVNPIDRRQHALRLTDKGRAVLNGARSTAAEYEDFLRSALSEREAKDLLKSLHKLAGLTGTTAGAAAVADKLSVD